MNEYEQFQNHLDKKMNFLDFLLKEQKSKLIY